MTNPVGKGTRNVAVNLLDEEHRILGRLAMKDDRSLGDFIRRQLMMGLRMSNPDAALEMEMARKKRAEQMFLKI